MELILYIPTSALSDKLKQYLQSNEYQEMVQDFLEEVHSHSGSTLKLRPRWKLQTEENPMEGNRQTEMPANLVAKKERSKEKNNTSNNKAHKLYNYADILQSKATLSPSEYQLRYKVRPVGRGIKKEGNKNERKEHDFMTSGDRSVDRFLKLWYESGFRKHVKPGPSFNLTIERIRKLQSGTLFKQGHSVPDMHKGKAFNFSQFLFSVERFKKAAFDPDYFPKIEQKSFLRKLYLSQFLYLDFYSFHKNRSYFLHYLDNAPKQMAFTKDINPQLTDAIISSYIKNISNNRSASELVEQYLDKFRVASNNLTKVLELNNGNLHPMMITSLKDKADIIIKTAMHVFPDIKKIGPWTLASNFIMERIPVYMQNQGFFLAGPQQFSIYSYKGNGGHANSEKEKGGNGTGAANCNGNGGQHKVPARHSTDLRSELLPK